ncbi:MAG: hypothetical protein U0166_20845 [Acidobacteriota bacterium]
MLALDLGSQEQTLFSVEAIAERFLDFLGDSVMARTIGIALRRRARSVPSPSACVGAARRATSSSRRCSCEHAAGRREAIMTPDVRNAGELGESLSMQLKPASVPAVAVPLIVGREVVAVFYVDRDPGAERPSTRTLDTSA